MLCRAEILAAMKEPLAKRLIICPLLDERQIGDVSVDIRLGSEFIIFRRGNIPVIRPMDKASADRDMFKWREYILVPKTRELVLHPGELILGSSLEYFRLPGNLGAYVTSRSSWGRQGLVIATATAVAPGFGGVITLEMANLGNAPLTLCPGVRIAQILFHRTQGNEIYTGKYHCPTAPELGKIHLDEDLDFWMRR